MKFLLCLAFCFLSMLAWAQGQDNEAQLKNLSEKCADYHRKTEGESNGYRIKIHFGADKAKAREVKQKFSEKHRGIPAYEKYQQPNFVIVVGNFKTHIEAYTVFKQIQPDFPNAFIIKEKIKPIRD